jgi:hypothetical protein
MTMSSADLQPVEIEQLTRRGRRLAWFTVGYNVVEGVVAVTAGARERRALKLVAATFFLLAVYVVVEGSVA